MIRFLLDEHVPHAIAHGLRLRGIDVLTLSDAGLLSAADGEILLYALRESRVIFTQDDDFLKLAASGRSHAGVVYAKQHRKQIGEIVQFLEVMNECFDESEMVGLVEFL